LAVAGVVVNNYPETPDLAEQGAPRQIEALSGAPLLGVWPHINECWRLEAGGLEDGRLEAGGWRAGGGLEGRYAVVERLAGWLNEQPGTDAMLRKLVS
jgi:dethiobiotin synthetase